MEICTLHETVCMEADWLSKQAGFCLVVRMEKISLVPGMKLFMWSFRWELTNKPTAPSKISLVFIFAVILLLQQQDATLDLENPRKRLE